MNRRPHRSPLFPYTTLFHSLNRLHSALLLLSLTGLAGATGSVVGGSEGLLLGAGMALLFLLLDPAPGDLLDRKSTRLNSSHANISYALFCLKKKILSYYCNF